MYKAKYFSPNEAGLDNGRYEKLQPELLKKLDELRESYGYSITITSSYRSPDHPIEARKKNGPGAHSEGSAADCAVIGGEATLRFVTAAIAVGFRRIGISRKNNFCHVDVSPDRVDSIWTY